MCFKTVDVYRNFNILYKINRTGTTMTLSGWSRQLNIIDLLEVCLLHNESNFIFAVSFCNHYSLLWLTTMCQTLSVGDISGLQASQAHSMYIKPCYYNSCSTGWLDDLKEINKTFMKKDAFTTTLNKSSMFLAFVF